MELDEIINTFKSICNKKFRVCLVFQIIYSYEKNKVHMVSKKFSVWNIVLSENCNIILSENWELCGNKMKETKMLK